MQQTEIDALVCIALDVHLWTGRRKLTPKDLKKVAATDLPPEDLASLGSKKICNPELVNQFTRIKRAAERAILEAGYRIWGIYALPEDKVAGVVQKLKTLECEFQDCKASFIRDYDRSIADWVDAHPEWASIIQQAVTPVDEVERRLSFGFRVFRVKPAPVEDGENGETSMMEDSYHAIIKEVAQMAGETWDKSFKGRFVVTQRALRPISTMRNKLNGLSFIDPRIFPVVEQIDATLANCPKTGKIDSGPLQGLNGLMLLLSDARRITEHGEAAIGMANGEFVEPEDTAEFAEDAESKENDAVVAEEHVAEETTQDVVPPVRKQSVTSESGLFF